MRKECVIDHTGTEISYNLKVAEDGFSFTLTFRDGETRTITVEERSRIEFVFPSFEGTVVVCRLANGQTWSYDVRDGRKLTGEELRAINPHFYN
ncbi:MAG: hypothetical protein PHR36_01325 [Patescibacteria group bacterium]|nr:hypothetical protein [Patescibacteria group bacterium]